MALNHGHHITPSYLWIVIRENNPIPKIIILHKHETKIVQKHKATNIYKHIKIYTFDETCSDNCLKNDTSDNSFLSNKSMWKSFRIFVKMFSKSTMSRFNRNIIISYFLDDPAFGEKYIEGWNNLKCVAVPDSLYLVSHFL